MGDTGSNYQNACTAIAINELYEIYKQHELHRQRKGIAKDTSNLYTFHDLAISSPKLDGL